MGLSHYLCVLHLTLRGQDSFIVFPCLTRKALQLLSPLVSYLFNLQDPLCSNFAFSNFIFTFKVNVICQANHIFFGSLSVKLFLNLTFWGPILADLNSSLSSTIPCYPEAVSDPNPSSCILSAVGNARAEKTRGPCWTFPLRWLGQEMA